MRCPRPFLPSVPWYWNICNEKFLPFLSVPLKLASRKWQGARLPHGGVMELGGALCIAPSFFGEVKLAGFLPVFGIWRI